MEAQKIIALVTASYKNLAEHAFQTEVNSPYLRQVKDNLAEIEKLCQSPQPVMSAPIRKIRNTITDKTSLLKIAYAMSRFDYPLIQSITNSSYNQTEAFDFLARTTGTKATTLKNMRDQFDPYVKQERSNRKGWHQAELPSEYKAIKNQYDKKTEEDVTTEIIKILKTMK